jgi:hypothetical protein
MTTGRSVFKYTLDMLAANILHFGHFEENQIGVLVNYDPTFCNLRPEEFLYKGKYVSCFSEVLHIGPADIQCYQSKMRALGLNTDEAELLCLARGFGNKKNLILLRALLNGYEFVLFWDDDEYPVICLEEPNGIAWQQTDVLGAHLSELTIGADVTSGFWTGHVFPNVPGINRILKNRTARMLGEALGRGTETHSKYSFISCKKSFEIGRNIPNAAEIIAVGGGKWVSGGNISIRMQSQLEGIIPPYYTPRDSRGEDTIFSLHLSRAKVMAVPSGAFHDMYLDHPAITEGDYPLDPGYVPQNMRKYLARFGEALNAWLAYAPLFIRLSKGTAYRDVLREMIVLLRDVDRTLFIEFPQLGEALRGRKLADILADYSCGVEEQYQELRRCHDVWQRLCRRIRSE